VALTTHPYLTPKSE